MFTSVLMVTIYAFIIWHNFMCDVVSTLKMAATLESYSMTLLWILNEWNLLESIKEWKRVEIPGRTWFPARWSVEGSEVCSSNKYTKLLLQRIDVEHI